MNSLATIIFAGLLAFASAGTAPVETVGDFGHGGSLGALANGGAVSAAFGAQGGSVISGDATSVRSSHSHAIGRNIQNTVPVVVPAPYPLPFAVNVPVTREYEVPHHVTVIKTIKVPITTVKKVPVEVVKQVTVPIVDKDYY